MGKNIEIAEKKLKRLKKVGLIALTFSFDYFHQEFIPIDGVRNAIIAAISIGFENEGPIGLLNLAEERGFQQNQNFVNECHLYYELRKYLQPVYPYSLAPEFCY